MSASNSLGTPFIELLTVDSTNNYAMGLIRAAMAQHGTAVFAHHQTKGKGQRNKEWLSENGKNIALSIIIEPKELNASHLFLLSMAMAIGVKNFVENYAVDDIKIKWPNDVYWQDRKAAGILIENIWQQGEWKFAVVGIGININQTHFEELSTKAVSLKQITGKDFDTIKLAKELCNMVNEQFSILLRDPSQIIAGYQTNLYKRNEKVKLKNGNRVFDAVVKEVTTNGELVVETNVEEKFDVGEVEWISNGQ